MTSNGVWTWQYFTAAGEAVAPGSATLSATPSATTEGFPSQADAESWLGEAWRGLLDEGIEQVSLLEDDRAVYGPMGLRPA